MIGRRLGNPEIILYGDNFAAGGVALNDGANTFTAIAEDIYGRKATNVMSANYPAAINFSYDVNGNMLSDGTRTFKYDGENRLTNVLVSGQWKTDFRYDGLGRKRIRREYTWTGSTWSRTNETRYVYDGFLVLQERNSNNVPRVTYTRGLDFSGSFSGAGGIGGLLGMTTHAQTSNHTHYFYHSDGMGNITALQDTNEVIQARYAYDPWGNLFSMSGAQSDRNRMRMAGKEWHPQSDLTDFGARFYNPNWQRWINEDPIGIAGGLNLYAYVGNSPFNRVDPWGFYALDEDGFPVQASGTLLDSYIYDEETYERHEEIFWEGVLNVIEFFEGIAEQAAEELAWKACPIAGSLKIVRDPAKKAAKEAAEQLGQLHHVISTKIHRALEEHPQLRNIYKRRDPEFVARAKNLAAHRGYQQWHRQLDHQVSQWIEDHRNATRADFENELRRLYIRGKTR